MLSHYHNSYNSIKEIFLDFKVNNIFELQDKIEKEFKEQNKSGKYKYAIIEEVYIESVFETEIVEDIELDKKLKEELDELDNLVRAKRREIENVKFR